MDRSLVGCGRFCPKSGLVRRRRHLHSDIEMWSGAAEGYTDQGASLGMVEARRWLVNPPGYVVPTSGDEAPMEGAGTAEEGSDSQPPASNRVGVLLA